MANLRDRGYSSSMDNYNQQQEKKKRQQEQRKQNEATNGPVSAQKAKTLSLPKVNSTANNRAASTSAPIQTQRFYKPTPAATAPGTVNTPAMSRMDFEKAPGLVNLYGNYNNYVANRPVTNGGWSPMSQKDEDSLRYRADQANLAWEAYDRVAQDFKKSTQPTPAENILGVSPVWKQGEKQIKANGVLNLYDNASARTAEYEQAQQAYDDNISKIRRREDIEADIGQQKAELEQARKTRAQLDRQISLTKTLGDIGQNVGGMIGQYNIGAKEIENAMNLTDEIHRLDTDIDLRLQKLAVTEAELEQANHIYYINMTGDRPVSVKRASSPEAKDLQNKKYTGLDVVLSGVNSVVPVFSAIDEITGSHIMNRAGIEKSSLNQVQPEEWALYQDILENQGEKEANKYLQYLNDTTLRSRRRASVEAGARQEIADNPWYSDWSWLALSTLMSPLKVSSFGQQTVDMLVNGKMTKDAAYNDVSFVQNAMRGEAALEADEWAKNKYGNDTVKVLGRDFKPASFATQAATSVLDNLYLLGLTGGFDVDEGLLAEYNQGTVNLATQAARDAAVRAENANLLTMGFAAAPDAVIEAKDRGLSDSQAYILGAAAGMFEILTEKVSLDALFENLGNKNFLAYLATTGGTEASEEVNSGLLNTVLDVWVSQDQSEWRQAIRNYQKEHPGTSDDDALKAAFEDKMFELAQEGAAGFLSGIGMSAGMSGGTKISGLVQNAESAVNAYNSVRQAYTNPENIDKIVREGLSAKKGTAAYVAAEALQAKVDSDEKITVRDVKKAATVIDTQKRTDRKYVGKQIETARSFNGTEAAEYAADLRAKLDRGEDVTIKEVNTLERKTEEARVTSPKSLRVTIEAAKVDESSPAYKQAVKIEQKLDAGQTVSIRDAMRLQNLEMQARRAALSGDNAETIGRYLTTDLGKPALVYAAKTLTQANKESYVQRGEHLLQDIDNVDATTAGQAFIDARKLRANTRQMQKQAPRVLHPREVTADMDAYDRSAAEIGISVEEAQRNKAILTAFGVEGEYKSFENNNLSAYYDRSTGKVYINANADNPGLALIAHEVTHSFENTAAYGKLRDLIFSQKGDLNAELARITQEYADAGINLDDDGARSELVSEFVEQHMFNDEKFINDVVSTDRSLAQRFLRAIDNLLAKLGNKDAQQRKLLRDARDLWAKALQQRKTSDAAKEKIAEKRSEAKKLTLPTAEAKAAAVRKTEGPNLPKAESTKIRNANAELNQYGINIDADSGAAVSYSIRTAPTTVDEIKLATDRLVNAGFDRADAESWLKSLTSVSSVIMQNMQGLDYEADERYTWLKTNSEYTQGSVDFNNNCPKRAQFTAVFDRLQQMMPDRVFSASDYETIRQILIKHNISVTCGPCFVEDRRQHTGEIAQKFIDQLKSGELKNKFRSKIGNDTYIPTQYDLVTYEGLRGLYDSHRGIHDAFVAFNNARGMQAARLLEGLAEYNNQIKKWNKRAISSKNSKGGLRIFSLSDADPRNMIDMIQIVIDSAEKGLMIQGYTKKPWFAKFIKDTGVRILRSHIPAGNGVRNGRLVFDNVEGINTNDPDYFDATNERNIGDTVIGINDEMIRIAMLDPNIDQIIPFHTQLAKDIRDQKKIGHWTPYNGLEDRNVSDGKKADKQINIYKDVLQAWEKKGTPITNRQEFVEAFLQVCDERGLIPRFDKFLNVDENGKYVYTPGYEKFLVDYKLFDRTTGEIIPQEAVKPIFEDAYNQSVLKNYVKGTKNLPKVSEDVFDEIKRHFTDDKLSLPKAEGKQYAISKSDTAYLKAVESGDMETAQRMVDEAARKAGYTVRKYHGTRANFNVFNSDKSLHGASGFGYYFGDKTIADEFGKGGKVLRVLIKPQNIGTLKSHNIGAEGFESAVQQLGLSPQKTYMYYGADTAADYIKGKHDYRLATDLQYWANDPQRFAADASEKAKSPSEILSILRDSLGLDGIERGYELVLWDNSLVKLADPVTYDDSGKPIPLSERFNPENKDIRYAISKDATLNLPSVNDRAVYIKDSTDANGNPVSFVDLILDGQKLGETRNTRNLPVGEWVGISKGGKNPTVVGRVIFGEPIRITNQSPEYADAHIEGTGYDLKDGESKWYYPVEQVEDFRDNPRKMTSNAPVMGRYQYAVSKDATLEENLGYHAGDLGKAEYLKNQGRSRGTGHFGTGTYFVGTKEKVTEDSHYGKRPQHAVDFSDYNLYKVRNDRDGYRLHDALRVIDGGLDEAFVKKAEAGAFSALRYTDVYDMAKKKFGENLYGDDYEKNMISVITDYANQNGIEIQSREEYLKDSDIDEEDADFYYLDYLKETVQKAVDEVNDEYSTVRKAIDNLEFSFHFDRPKIIRALNKVLDYQKATPRFSKSDSYATVFMKAMGYDGVDVRGTGLDNTGYGSVIYDIKKDTIRYAINKDATIRTESELIDSVIDPKETAKAGVQDAVDAYIDSVDMTKEIPGRNAVRTSSKSRAKANDNGRFLYRKMVDSGEAVSRLGRYANDSYLYPYYNMARASSNAAISMIQNAQTDVMGRRVGDSLNDIFSAIRAKGDEYYSDLQLYLYHLHNIARMSRANPGAVATAQDEYEAWRKENPEFAHMLDSDIKKIAYDSTSFYQDQARQGADIIHRLEVAQAIKNKPIFGYEVSEDVSRDAVEKLRKKLEQTEGFEEDVEKIRKYIDNLMQYRIDSGLFTEENYEKLKKIYPDYVPVFYEYENGKTRKGAPEARTEIGSTVGRAQGVAQETPIMPLHKALAQQTLSAVREGSKNRFGQRLLEKQNLSRNMIKGIDTLEPDFNEETFEQPDEKRKNAFVVRMDGKRYEMTLGKDLYEAIDVLSPSPQDTHKLLDIYHKAFDLFKAGVTGYNPVFAVKNPIRDLQDAGLYSKDLSEFVKQYPKTAKEIRKNGKYWQLYQAMGGLYSSVFDYEKGELEEHSWLRRNSLDRMEALNMAIEQAPRLAEFMATIKKAEARGEVTMDDLMEAVHNAADVTVNFGRSGKWGKWLNRNVLPFFNPGIQGADKFVRRFTETKGAKDWLRLTGKAALFGILPAILNKLLWGKRKDWDELKQSDRDNYYLFPIPWKEGVWLRLPKGRALALFGMATDRIIQGKDADWASFITTGYSNLGPSNPLKTNFLTPLLEADLFDPDSPGTTWYGGDIESQRLQNLAPGERYDASTDALSKWLGKTFNLSPKKINYILDQYSGVIGDILIPLTSDRAEKDMFSAAFTIDTVTSNRLSDDFYKLSDELTWAKNDPESGPEDSLVSKYWAKQTSAVSDINKAIRSIEEDKTLTDKEKRELIRAQYAMRNGIMRNALDTLDDYRKAVEEAYASSTKTDPDDRLDEAYREANKNMFGAEYALQTYNKKVYEAATQLREDNGISYDGFYKFYFARQEVQDQPGTSAECELIMKQDMNDSQKQALYEKYISHKPITLDEGMTMDDFLQAKIDKAAAASEPKISDVMETQAKQNNPNWDSMDSKQQKYATWDETAKSGNDLTSSMSDSEARKYQTATDHGIDTDVFVNAYKAVDQADLDNDANRSYKQEEVKTALDSMDLTNEQRAVLWQVISSAKSGKNNPYDPELGQQIYDEMQESKASSASAGKKPSPIRPMGLRLPKIG